MGGNQSMSFGGHHHRSTTRDKNGNNAVVSLEDFVVIRAIGRGSFGKVSVVRRRTGCRRESLLFAMKYVDKAKCIERLASNNVIREIEILARLDHPFIVNMWYSFQDDQYMYVVVDLMLGGDLSYHLNKQGRFTEDRAKLYICEMALALDYLQSRRVVHRDIKPSNILLDDKGHSRLTDFNVATVLSIDSLATSTTGTRPYMAPEIFETALGECVGYSFGVDWWSLGVCAFEMNKGTRPFSIHYDYSTKQVKQLLFASRPQAPADWCGDLASFINQLLCTNVANRITTLHRLRAHPYMTRIDFKQVLRKHTEPTFVPNTNAFNCDPTYELEELLIESKPIHCKKKRKKADKKKVKDVRCNSDTGGGMSNEEDAARRSYSIGQLHVDSHQLVDIDRLFPVYNRETLLANEDDRLNRLELDIANATAS